MAIKSADDDDGDEEGDTEKNVELSVVAEKKHKAAKNSKTKVTWVGEPVKKLGKKSFYGEVQVGEMNVSGSF